jgi:hypothetical protein
VRVAGELGGVVAEAVEGLGDECHVGNNLYADLGWREVGLEMVGCWFDSLLYIGEGAGIGRVVDGSSRLRSL